MPHRIGRFRGRPGLGATGRTQGSDWDKMFKNLYLETTRVALATPTLATDLTADAVIIGGGYTGLSAARTMAAQGLRVILLEAGEIGHGCSGRNGGQVNPGLKALPDDVEAHFGPERGRRLNQMSSDAPGAVFDLIDTLGIDCAPRRTGTIRAAIDAAGVAQVRALADQCTRRGWPVHFVNAAEMARLTGTNIYRAGAFDARGGHINPLGYARGLALSAEASGAQLFSQSRATALRRNGSGWTVTTAKGSVTAPEIVICTNGYTDGLWPGFQKSLIPVWTYIAATDPLPAALRSKIMPSQSALYEAAWDVVYYRLDDAGRLLMGGRGPQRDAKVPADYTHLIRYARKLWPELKEIAFPYGWHGQVAVTDDHFPHLVNPEQGVHLMYGYNGRGIAISTAAGQMVGERILSGGAADVAWPVENGLTPVRYHDFWRVGAEATMLWHRLCDRLRGR